MKASSAVAVSLALRSATKSSLPAPEGAARADTRKPETDLERTLAELWAEVLGVREVGLDENFFELGGDSMHAITLTGRAWLRVLRLSVEDVCRNLTVAGQGERCAAAVPDEPGEPAGDDRFAMLPEADRALFAERDR